MESQLKKIAKYLKSGKSITQKEAYFKFECFRLSAIIFKLKNDYEMKIKSTWKTKGKKRFTAYSLVK